jgi:ribosomal-protein-alanine N-acetyltransferase
MITRAGLGWQTVPMQLHSPRLTLRPLRIDDAPSVFAMNGDPVVMAHFAAPMTRAESDAWLARLMAHQVAHGFSFCALDLPGAPCIGVVGLLHIPWQARFTPAVEIGWRILHSHQGQGYAREAAELVLAHGFGTLGLAEIVAFTVQGNRASWRLMQRLGMRADGEFGHPRLAPDHPLHRHLLYRLSAP